MSDAPLKIGNKTINSRIMLAPMAGVTDVVFRKLVRDWAPQSLICTEMISSNGIVYSKRYNAPILDKTTSDHPIAYQLAAHKESVLIEAARSILMNKAPDTIDLNMGCPVKKITGNFEGCALMKDLSHASHLISALVTMIEKEGLDTPVTVKFRLGWDENSQNYTEFGKMCEDAGAKMVTLHARTRAQGYKPGCKWEAFGHLKQAVGIPVIANGDIASIDDILSIMATYGVDGVMIGRGTLGKPWLIGQLDEALKTGRGEITALSIQEQLDTAYLHARLLSEYRGETGAIREMRRHLSDYIKGIRSATQFRQRLSGVEHLTDVRQILDEVLHTATASEFDIAV
ncbi:MAG: tRNA dihydrouridine synthase DusB [Cyanobacteria bacterium P01_H01_bin.74]